MRFLLDMNLPPAIATRLQAEGHDAIHVRDAGYGICRTARYSSEPKQAMLWEQAPSCWSKILASV
jgi:hypothetical protein